MTGAGKTAAPAGMAAQRMSVAHHKRWEERMDIMFGTGGRALREKFLAGFQDNVCPGRGAAPWNLSRHPGLEPTDPRTRLAPDRPGGRKMRERSLSKGMPGEVCVTADRRSPLCRNSLAAARAISTAAIRTSRGVRLAEFSNETSAPHQAVIIPGFPAARRANDGFMRGENEIDLLDAASSLAALLAGAHRTPACLKPISP